MSKNHLKDISILIIEDEAVLALGLKYTLKNFGYSVSGIENSMQGTINHLNSSIPDLALVDIKLKNSIPDDYTQQVLVYYCNVLRKTKNDEGIIKTRLSYPIIIAKSERLPTHYCDIINKNKVIKENLWNQNKKLMKPVKSYHHVKLAGIIETSQDK